MSADFIERELRSWEENPEFFYTEKDRSWLLEVKERAERLWRDSVGVRSDAGKVEGYCVYFKPKGKKRPREILIAYASNDGSLGPEATRWGVEAFLIKEGVKNFRFNWGSMDW